MTDVLTTTRYVARNPDVLGGEPTISDSQVAVRDVVLLWKSGILPETISAQLMGLVTTAQVFDALSFYLDNQAEIDERIAWYEARPLLNIPVSLRCNPLLDEVDHFMQEYRRDRNAELHSLEA